MPVHQDGVDANFLTLPEARGVIGEFQSHIIIIRTNRNARGFAHDAPAGFDNADNHISAHGRAIAFRRRIDIDRDARLAFRVGRCVWQGQEAFVKTAVYRPETIAAKIRERIGVKSEARFGFHRKTARRRAVKKAAFHGKLARLAGTDRCFLITFKFHLKALRHEVLDGELLRTDKAIDAVRLDLDRPHAARRGGRHAIVEGEAANGQLINAALVRFGAVGAANSDSKRAALNGFARIVTQKAGDMHRLARAIDAAIEIDEGVNL